ncbi:competence type IV pilus major pilin ComGC [Gracilibacillus thailandensis]|uniref:Prepilin-type N-terminal cleavage/methylation domain-containing protein n=1 Tax=Gracilibacillus thailandensis TaxID=563735 RepID=A0A6N7R3F5_9BACI|nr:type II secretion system protein [Gracilibacillus thailandensis]MRI67596.1 prepilin-type N-terminal cleavage/methylation domain-containing protein [Gracilibacillus thailandensis]
MREIWKKWNKEDGFTLVELLAVIVILGIIVAIAVPAIGSIIDRAEEGAQEAEAELIENAARLALIAAQADGEEADWVFDGGDQPNITVQELLDNGYLETDDPPSGTLRHVEGTTFTFERDE